MIKQLIATAALLLPAGLACAEELAANEYVIPEDAKCIVRPNDKLTYCTDKKGAPITGVLNKYRENELVRTYPLKDGLLHGLAEEFYVRGGKISEKPYVEGKINGTVSTWYFGGALESVTPYVDGKKEGVAKFYHQNGNMLGQGIYVGDKLNGPMRLYTLEQQPVYEIIYEENVVVSGSCVYKTELTDKDKAEIAKEKAGGKNATIKVIDDKYKLAEKALDTEMINLFNMKAKQPLNQIDVDDCATQKGEEPDVVQKKKKKTSTAEVGKNAGQDKRRTYVQAVTIGNRYTIRTCKTKNKKSRCEVDLAVGDFLSMLAKNSPEHKELAGGCPCKPVACGSDKSKTCYTPRGCVLNENTCAFPKKASMRDWKINGAPLNELNKLTKLPSRLKPGYHVVSIPDYRLLKSAKNQASRQLQKIVDERKAKNLRTAFISVTDSGVVINVIYPKDGGITN